MNQKLWTKVIASMLVITLTCVNFIMLGVYTSNSYATTDDYLERQETVTNNENVMFDAYFKDENGTITHTKKENMSSQSLKLYLSVQVKKGYLKDAKIQVLGENTTKSNLEVKSSNENLEYIQSIDEASNSIYLKQVNSGTQLVLEVPVVAPIQDNYDISNFSKINDMVLTGTYIGDEGKKEDIQKTIQTRVEWTENVSPILEQQLLRFIPYQVEQNNGTIVQILVTSGIANNTLPVEETKITVNVPSINGKYPNMVHVVPNGILATTGKEVESFTQDNWNYDSETGELIITVHNLAQENRVSWLKNIKDEFVITYQYEEKVDSTQILQTVTSNVKVYNSVETELSAHHELAVLQNETLGQIVTGKVSLEETLSKGYLYTKTDKEVIYNENITIDISYPELVDILTITQDMDYFVAQENLMQKTNDTYYKMTKISKKNLEAILGEEGNLTIQNAQGENLVIFNKDSQVDENGDYVFEFEVPVNQIKIITSAPVAIGKLELRYQKALNGNTNYTKQEVESFKALKVGASIEAKVGQTTISSMEATNQIALIAPSTKIEAMVSNTNLSTVVTNENVELRVILKTNDITCDLYKNPTIEIVLPNYISKVDIKDINLPFDDELTIKDYSIYINNAGNIVICVNIEGEQTRYNFDQISKGANLIIHADIALKQLTPTKNDVMKVYVKNELATTYEQVEQQKTRTTEQRGYVETSLNAVAPVGMVTTNTISDYNAQNESVTSMSSQERVGKLDVKKVARTANVSMSIINNYQNTVSRVNILGRVPTKDSKNADTKEDLGSNLTLTMASAINVSGIDASSSEIYYSTKLDATNDVNLAINGWTKTPENIANVKSYLIMVAGEMQTGTAVNISYNLAIPENLGYNMQAYSNYVVYFDNMAESGITSEKAVATKVGLETGDGPELEVSLSSDKENGSNVEEGELITYTINVKNVGKSEVENVTISGLIPEKTKYTYLVGEGGEDGIERMYDTKLKTYSEVIEKIAVGETKTITYQVETNDLLIGYDVGGNIQEVEEVVIQNTAKAVVQGNDIEFTSNTLENKLIQGYLNINMKVEVIPEEFIRAVGDEVTYAIYIKNVNSLAKENLTVKTTLPEGVTYIGSNYRDTYNEQTREVVWNIQNLQPKAQLRIQFGVTVDDLEANTHERIIKTRATVTGEKEVTSNETKITVQKASLTITQTSDTKKTVTEGDTITYHFEVKNTGMGDAADIEVSDYLPEGLEYNSVQYSYHGKTYDAKLGTANSARIRIGGLSAGETLSISIKAIAKNLGNGVKQKEVTNTATVKADGIEEITSNQITHTIVAKAGSSVDDPSTDGKEEGTYSISGIAWLDSNHDGRRDDNEERLSNIPVILMNADNGQIVQDITTKKEKKQQTSQNGEYVFANLKPGQYMVIFLYDSANYGVTLYKQAGINHDKNSDVVQMDVTYQGTKQVAGVSDKLELANENIGNIDIGLTISPKFDLKLEKVVSKITVSDATGTDVYDYKDETVAKLDLNSKTANGTSIMIEYKIRVINEGGVAGYAKNIVDYMPQDMKFTSELNKDWYTSDNGMNLYNTSLANTLIQPGETKEVTLLLTKKITDSNMGIIHNTAEIAESYNDLGLQDVDSQTANKVQNEDDMSSADVIVGTKTGEIYMYMVLTIAVITILGTGIFLIKKKVLGNK